MKNKMNSRTRVFKAAGLLLRDNFGNVNKNAIEVFDANYYNARNEGLSVQAAVEIAMIRALGESV